VLQAWKRPDQGAGRRDRARWLAGRHSALGNAP
jgi:hypothetical protein